MDRKKLCFLILTLDYTDLTCVWAVDNYRSVVQVGLRRQKELNSDMFDDGFPSLVCRRQHNLVREDSLCDKHGVDRLRGPGDPATIIVFYPESDREGIGFEVRLDAWV